MAGKKINWSIWRVPVGPERFTVRKRVFHAPERETLVRYEELRQSDNEKHGLVVTDQDGLAVFCCS